MVLKFLREKVHTNPYILFTLSFIIIFFVGFHSFWVTGHSFAIIYDGVHQHLLWLQYQGIFLRQVIRSFLEGNPGFPTNDFRIGLGHDIFMVAAHHPLITPLDLLTVFVPARHTAVLYDFIMVARFYLAGITFIHLCKYLKRESIYAVIGALTYVFSSWTFTHFLHNFFLIPLILLPLIIEGLDKILIGKKPTMFIFSVFAMAFTSYYFLYKIVIFAFFYTVTRVFQLHPHKYFKNLLSSLAYITITGVVGIVSAGIALLPSILFFFAMPSRYSNIDNLWSMQGRVEDLFMGLVASSRDLGFAAITTLSLIWLIFGVIKRGKHVREKIHLIVLLAIFLLMRFTVVGNYVMSGFAEPNIRWMFILSFLFSLIVVKSLPSIIVLTKSEFFIGLFVIIIYGLFAVFNPTFRSLNFFFGFAMLATMLALLGYSYVGNLNEKFMLLKKYSLLALIILNVSINADFYLRDGAITHTDFYGVVRSFRFAQREDVRGDTDYFNVSLPDRFIPTPDDFYRINVNPLIGINAAMIRNHFGLSYYWSVAHPYLSVLATELELNHVTNFRMNRFGTPTFLNALLSTRYYMPTTQWALLDTPYGFKETNVPEWEMQVFKNLYSLPLGFTYKHSISTEQYLSLNPIERREILLHAVVIDTIPDYKDKEILRSLDTVQLPYEILEKEGLSWENGILTTTQANARMVISFVGMNYSETYIRFVNLTNYDNDRLSTITVVGAEGARAFRPSFPSDWGFSPEDHLNYTRNMGFSEISQTQTIITFVQPGTFRLENIEIYALPFENYSYHINNLRAEYLRNLYMSANRVRGEITVSSNRYLFFSIPYSRGWRAFVNGERTEVLRANTAFMAVELMQGHHTIELRYRTPGLLPGAFLSLLGVLMCLLLAKYHNQIIKIIRPEQSEERRKS